MRLGSARNEKSKVMSRWYFEPVLGSYAVAIGLALVLAALLLVSPKFKTLDHRQRQVGTARAVQCLAGRNQKDTAKNACGGAVEMATWRRIMEPVGSSRSVLVGRFRRVVLA